MTFSFVITLLAKRYAWVKLSPVVWRVKNSVSVVRLGMAPSSVWEELFILTSSRGKLFAKPLFLINLTEQTLECSEWVSWSDWDLFLVQAPLKVNHPHNFQVLMFFSPVVWKPVWRIHHLLHGGGQLLEVF